MQEENAELFARGWIQGLKADPGVQGGSRDSKQIQGSRVDPGAQSRSRGPGWIQGLKADPGVQGGSRGSKQIQGSREDPGAQSRSRGPEQTQRILEPRKNGGNPGAHGGFRAQARSKRTQDRSRGPGQIHSFIVANLGLIQRVQVRSTGSWEDPGSQRRSRRVGQIQGTEVCAQDRSRSRVQIQGSLCPTLCRKNIKNEQNDFANNAS